MSTVRLGCIRVMRWNMMNFKRPHVIGMHAGSRPILGWDISLGKWHVQIAQWWWGFGVDR